MVRPITCQVFFSGNVAALFTKQLLVDRFQIGFLVCSVAGSELILFLQLVLPSVCHLPVSDW